jgi:hypothetical protein
MAKLNINLEDDFDFGFSAVSEDELTAREKEAEDRARAEAEQIIKQQQEEATSVIDEVTATAQEYKDRLALLHKMVLPLLKNLEKDSDTKPYIYWPDRKKKMQEFMARVNAVVNG